MLARLARSSHPRPWRFGPIARRRLLVVGAIVSTVGCASCSSCQCGRTAPESRLVDGGASTPSPPAPAITVEPATGWVWYDTGNRAQVALPAGCQYIGPPLRAEVPAAMRWAVGVGERATLLVATGGDASEDAGEWALSHAGALSWAVGKEQREQPSIEPVPWQGCSDCPAARDSTSGTWLLAWSAAQLEGPSRVWAWRGGDVELVAEGDRLDVADVACDRAGRCGVLTGRVAKVARPGADLWVGRTSDPIRRWQHHGMDLDWEGGGAPLALLWDEPKGVPVVAFSSAGAVRLATATSDATAAVRETFDAPHGGIGATLAPRPAALSWLTPPEEGCAAGRSGVGFQRAGGARHELSTATAPIRASLAALGKGYWIDVLAPARCGDRRLVAYGAIAAGDGDEAPRLVALAEVDDFAVAVAGEALDVWVRRGRVATWIRARCVPGSTAAPPLDGTSFPPTPMRDSPAPSARAGHTGSHP